MSEIHVKNRLMRAQCGAKTRSGGPCRGIPMANGRCRMHNGGASVGIAASRFQTGKYSKYLPARMLPRYHEAQHDSELLAMREEIALLDGRLADVLQRVDTGESSILWKRLQGTWTAFRRAQAAGDTDGAAIALTEHADLLQRGTADSFAWSEISSLIEQRRKVVESERKRLIDMQQMITSERAMVLLAAVADTIRRNVTDRNALNAISHDLRALMDSPTR